MWERLDRAIGTNNWLTVFSASKVIHLECGSFDHKPIIIHPLSIPVRRQKPWCFDQVWIQEDGCHDTVKSAWQIDHPGSYMEKVIAKVAHYQTQLKFWSKHSFGNITRSLVEKRMALKKAEAEVLKGSNYDSVFNLKKEITELLIIEEKLWQQRSKSHWISGGLKTQHFFHSKASQRFRRNQISSLRNSLGEMCYGDDNVSNLLIDYYQALFTTSNPCDIDHVLQYIP